MLQIILAEDTSLQKINKEYKDRLDSLNSQIDQVSNQLKTADDKDDLKQQLDDLHKRKRDLLLERDKKRMQQRQKNNETQNEETSSLRQERLESLAVEFRKLKCRADVTGDRKLRVTATKYPFKWCIERLGWRVIKSTDGQHRVYAREDGSFKLNYLWQGMDFLFPVGPDWDAPDV